MVGEPDDVNYDSMLIGKGQSGKKVDRMSRELTLRCEDSLDGIFTAIYDAFVYKNQIERPYTDSIKIAIGEGNLTLFSTELAVAKDPETIGIFGI